MKCSFVSHTKGTCYQCFKTLISTSSTLNYLPELMFVKFFHLKSYFLIPNTLFFESKTLKLILKGYGITLHLGGEDIQK